MHYEHKVWAPLWLELSGLPEWLNEKARGGAAWAVFKKLVELDCALNPRPGLVEISINELAQRTGVDPKTVRRLLTSFRKLEVVACFLPDNDEEEALVQIRVPLPTPLNPDRVRALHPELFERPTHYFRYAQSETESEEENTTSDPLLEEIVDLYFHTIGLKMNAFILDELRLIRHQFPIELVRRTFQRAAKNDIHSLHWVVRELIRQKRAKDEKEDSGTQDLSEM